MFLETTRLQQSQKLNLQLFYKQKLSSHSLQTDSMNMQNSDSCNASGSTKCVKGRNTIFKII